MAITDVGTKLYAKGLTTYEELVSIISAPATGSAAGTIEDTTLDSPNKTFELDRPELPKMEFKYNYTEVDFTKVTAAISLTVAKDYLIVYQDGSGVKFTGKGNQWIEAVGRGSVVEAGINFALSSLEVIAALAVTTLLAVV